MLEIIVGAILCGLFIGLCGKPPKQLNGGPARRPEDQA